MSLPCSMIILGLVAVAISGCPGDSSVGDTGDCGKKCGACWSCEFVSDAAVGGIEYDRAAVRSQVEGTWMGDGITATVALLTAAPRYGEPYHAPEDLTCDVPSSAAESCAGMSLPAEVDVELVDPAVVFRADALVVGGTQLAPASAVPRLRAYYGYPSVTHDAMVNGRETEVTVLFGPDAAWVSVDDAPFTRVGTRTQ